MYDAKGNILQMSKTGDVKFSYLWGHSDTYPIAQVINASSNEIFFDSFEEATGWDVYLTGYDNTKSHSGRFAGKIVNNSSSEQISRSTKWLILKLPAPRKFKFSGWVFSNGPSVEMLLLIRRAGDADYSSSERLETTVTGKWVYVEKEITVPADVIGVNLRLDNNGNGTAWYDDIRLHPSNAQMTTCTYDLLIGITSQSDVNNRITYYEYDGFGRLNYIRDENGNILKKYCYSYAGQVETCE